MKSSPILLLILISITILSCQNDDCSNKIQSDETSWHHLNLKGKVKEFELYQVGYEADAKKKLIIKRRFNLCGLRTFDDHFDNGEKYQSVSYIYNDSNEIWEERQRNYKSELAEVFRTERADGADFKTVLSYRNDQLINSYKVWFDKNSQPIKSVNYNALKKDSSWNIVHTKLDKNGNLIEQSVISRDDSTKVVEKWRYDKNNRLLETFVVIGSYIYRTTNTYLENNIHRSDLVTTNKNDSIENSVKQTYDQFQNIISTISYEEGVLTMEKKMEYKYDEFDNWIKCTTYSKIPQNKDSKFYLDDTQYRKISYY
jgi:hypothetical protein